MWLLSPSGWPTFTDDEDTQADLLARGYDEITEAEVPAAVAAFQAAESSPPSTQLPGYALAADVATALALKANASALAGKLSITDIANPASAGGVALRAASDARYVRFQDGSQMVREFSADSLTKVGPVLRRGPAGSFDAGHVESPCVSPDPVTGALRVLYVGYSNTDDVTAVASIGWATTTDGINMVKQGQFFTASGIPGSPDEMGVSGPVIIVVDGVEYLFYIGLTQLGYENGVKRMCLATRPVGGSWTRHGAVISPSGTGWYSTYVFHANLVRHGDEWLNFFNALGNPGGKERMGLARAGLLTGPWTVDATPLFDDDDEVAYASTQILQGDGFVTTDHRTGQPRMDYFVAPNSGPAYDTYATTTWDEFPYGWKRSGVKTVQASEPYDQTHAHKPWIAEIGGRLFHYYTAVGTLGRVIALAISGGGRRSMVTATAEGTRSTSSASIADIANTTVVVPAEGKVALQWRLVARARVNGAGSLILQPRVQEPAGATGYGADVTITSTSYVTAVGPWESLGGTHDLQDDPVRINAAFKIAGGATSGDIGQISYEFRWW